MEIENSKDIPQQLQILAKPFYKWNVEIVFDLEDVLFVYERWRGYGFRALLLDLVKNAFEGITGERGFHERPHKFPKEKNSITIKTYETNTHCYLKVSDTGQGMDVEKILAYKAGRGGGGGTKVIVAFVDHNDGILDIKSRPDVGTEITIILPKPK